MGKSRLGFHFEAFADGSAHWGSSKLGNYPASKTSAVATRRRSKPRMTGAQTT